MTHSEFVEKVKADNPTTKAMMRDDLRTAVTIIEGQQTEIQTLADLLIEAGKLLERAITVGEQLAGEPQLGYATTEQLLNELRARIEVDYFVGGGGLQYTTVDGRPEGSLDVDEHVHGLDLYNLRDSGPPISASELVRLRRGAAHHAGVIVPPPNLEEGNDAVYYPQTHAVYYPHTHSDDRTGR